MPISEFSNIEWLYLPYATTFGERFPIIYSEMQNQEISNVTPRVYISNVDLNENNNLDSYLQLALDDTSDLVNINGDWGSFEGYVVINDEILYLSNPTYLFSQYTRFECLRAQHFTKAFSHDSNTRVRSIQELEVIDYNYSHKANTSSTSLFAPVLSTGEIVFLDDVKKWIVTSTSKQYDLAKNKPVYIFEGAGKQMKCVFQGYIYDWNTDAKASEITLMFKDEFTLLNSKKIEFTSTYINWNTIDVIEDLLGSTVVYMNGTDINHYGKLDRISTNDYETYGEMLSYICEAKCMRMSYDEYGYVRVYSDLFTTTDTYSTDLEVRDSIDLVDINETTENTMVLNKFTCEFKNRYPYYNRNQFLDGSTLRYINFRYSLSSQYLTLMNSQGFKEFDLDLGTNIKYLTIGDYILLQDVVNNKEFRCKLFEINGTVGTFIGGFDRDRAWNPRGKNDYLLTISYANPRYFNVYYSELNMQTIFALNLESNGEEKSSNLKLPILPQEELEYNCTFGSFETNDLEFSGIVEEIDGIYGTLMGGTDLYYLQDYRQSETGIPVYLLSNKLTVDGTGNEQLYYYSSFDNSNIEVEISEANDNESNITVKIRNTLTSPTTQDITPLETIGRILRISSVQYAVTYTGDVLKLHADNSLDDRTEPYYSVNFDAKWTIESKFQEGSLYYIVLDKAYPIGDDNIQMKFTKYRYDKIIHLNELRIMGNPVVQQTQNISKLNADSISKYDELEYNFDGKLTNLEDLKYSISYLYNNFAGLPNNYTRLIPFEAFFRPDIELLDVVKLYDSSIVDMDAEEVIVIEKSVSVSGDGERSEKYIGVTKADNLADLTTLNVLSDKNYYTTLYPTEYNHNGNEGLDTELPDNVDDVYISKESTVGNISILKIAVEDYYGISQTTIRNDEKSLILYLYGDKSTYNTSVFKNGSKSVLLIGTEYLLVQSQTNITSSSTSVTLSIIERDIFGTGQYEITNGQTVQICQILNFTDKDGMIVDGTITVGSNNGKIEFIESGWTINDYKLVGGSSFVDGIDFTYFSMRRDTFNATKTFSISDLQGSLISTLDIYMQDLPFSVGYFEAFLEFNRGIIGGSTTTEYPITVKYLKVTDAINNPPMVIDNSYKSGMFSYTNNHFYGYDGSSWLRLDNESIDPYPGYADRVILPNNGTSLSSVVGDLEWTYNNLYFNVSSSQLVPLFSQYNQTYSSNISLNPYVGAHLIDVTSGARTVSINYLPSNTYVLGKTYEIIHMRGDVTSNNITIDGGSNSFYEIGSDTSLGTTLTINTTGGRVRLYATSTKWYVLEI